VPPRGPPPEYVDRPCLTIGLTVQPEVLRGLASRPGFGGRGLLARLLYSLPQRLGGRRPPRGAPPAPGKAPPGAWSAAASPAPHPSQRQSPTATPSSCTPWPPASAHRLG